MSPGGSLRSYYKLMYIASCGHSVMWTQHHVGTASCGHTVMWKQNYVDTELCGHSIM